MLAHILRGLAERAAPAWRAAAAGRRCFASDTIEVEVCLTGLATSHVFISRTTSSQCGYAVISAGYGEDLAL
jgi:hypothetical protein